MLALVDGGLELLKAVAADDAVMDRDAVTRIFGSLPALSDLAAPSASPAAGRYQDTLPSSFRSTGCSSGYGSASTNCFQNCWMAA